MSNGNTWTYTATHDCLLIIDSARGNGQKPGGYVGQQATFTYSYKKNNNTIDTKTITETLGRAGAGGEYSVCYPIFTLLEKHSFYLKKNDTFSVTSYTPYSFTIANDFAISGYVLNQNG